MSTYYIFSGADPKIPGSGFVEEKFDSPDDHSALEAARRHYEVPDHTLWAETTVNKLAHNQFRFVGYTKLESKNGSVNAAG